MDDPVKSDFFEYFIYSLKCMPRRTASSFRRRSKRLYGKLKKVPWRDLLNPLTWPYYIRRRFLKISHKLLVRKYWMRLGELFQYSPRPLLFENFPVLKTNPSSLPSILLVTPSFQQKDFLPLTLRSVIDQHYPRLSYIIQDGGSTDGTVKILESFSSHLHAWNSSPDKGQADAIEKAFKKGDGEIMAWLNSDDFLLPGSLHFIGSYFAENPDVDVLYGHRILVNSEGLEVGRWFLPPHENDYLRFVDYVPQETLFWRKSIYEKAGGIDPNFHFALDWDLLLRFQQQGAKIVRVPYFLGCFRVHPAQKTSSIINSKGMAEMEKLRHREHRRPVSQDEINQAAHRLQLNAAITARLHALGLRY